MTLQSEEYKILLVCGSTMLAVQLRMILESLGHTPTITLRWEQALLEASKELDLIIISNDIADVTSVHLMKIIQSQRDKHDQLPLPVFTIIGNKEKTDHFLDMGFEIALQQPLTTANIKNALKWLTVRNSLFA